jgi:hypothetical protein
MSAIQPFTPKFGSNVPFTIAGGAAVVVQLNGKGNSQVRIMNLSDNVIHVRDYNSTGTVMVATVADYPIAPKSSTIYTKQMSHDTLSLYCAAAASGHATLGEGW